MGSLEYSLEGRSSLYTVDPSDTISLNNTDWAPHEALCSWILEHCQLENLRRDATVEDQEDIVIRLKACEEQIDAAIEKLTISGPIFTPPTYCRTKLPSNNALKKNLNERICPNLCQNDPEDLTESEQKSSKTSNFLKELPSPSLEFDNTDCSSSATFYEVDSYSSESDGTTSKDFDAMLLSASRIDLRTFVKVCDIPEGGDSNLMKWAESSGVFNDIAPVPNSTVVSEAARKRKLHDVAMASRNSSRVWWVNVKDNTHIPEFESSSIEKLGTVEVEYKLSSTPAGLQVYFGEPAPEQNEKIWQRRGVNPPSPIETDIRKPGTLLTVKAQSDHTCPTRPSRKGRDTTKAVKHGNALYNLALKVRQLRKQA